MAISGSLKDVSVADVMQFIHLGRRTGTLLLTRGAQRAMIGFHGGRLVSAQAPGTPKLGDLLVSSGLINRRTLDDAIQTQASEVERRSLGQVLVTSGAIDAESLRRVIGQQLEQAASEVMVWDNGTFEFAIDDLRPIDDIAIYPSDVLPDADINTQMVLLEAARIFDERNRARSAAEALLDASPTLTGRLRGVGTGGLSVGALAPGGGAAMTPAAAAAAAAAVVAAAAAAAAARDTGGVASAAAAASASSFSSSSSSSGIPTSAPGAAFEDGDSTNPALEPALVGVGAGAGTPPAWLAPAAPLAVSLAPPLSGAISAAAMALPEALLGAAEWPGAASTAAPHLSSLAAGTPAAPLLGFDGDQTASRRRWELPKHAAERLHLQIVSEDVALTAQLREALRHEVAGIESIDVDQAGLVAPGEPPPIVVIDVRAGRVSLDEAAALRRSRPRASIVAVVDATIPVAKVYAAGMLNALPPDVETLAACVENLIESREDLVRGSSAQEAAVAAPGRSGVARLRRVFGDLRSGLISATVALNLMHIISESVERAVLFLVKRDHLVALGAFGADAQGRPLAELTRGIKLSTRSDSVFGRSLALGEVQSLSFEDAALPDPFRSLVGRSRYGQVVVFPVLGAQRVISVIYTDNGDRDEPIEDIDILELATAQVGMAFENELLRRQISQNRDE